ncbi:MAG: hypothetical protein EOO38_09965 [Cytophagaceae bacterium]|nr:MAG: hypothetical protein EOO38_09965 [Cytophagaceae bacterium]
MMHMRILRLEEDWLGPNDKKEESKAAKMEDYGKFFKENSDYHREASEFVKHKASEIVERIYELDAEIDG